MIEKIQKRVFEANLRLKSEGLIISTWGNVSEYDEASGLVAIKASGVKYDKLKPEDIVICDLDGNIVEGKLRPSTDLPTHLVLYKNMKGVRAIVHTHSMYATIWCQAEQSIPLYGTTHADYFRGDIPCTRPMTKEEIAQHYEVNTGNVILEIFKALDPFEMRAVLVNKHAPFVWGKDAHDAVDNAVALEYVAQMAWCDRVMPGIQMRKLDDNMLTMHFDRKYGANAYYGQKSSEGQDGH